MGLTFPFFLGNIGVWNGWCIEFPAAASGDIFRFPSLLTLDFLEVSFCGYFGLFSMVFVFSGDRKMLFVLFQATGKKGEFPVLFRSFCVVVESDPSFSHHCVSFFFWIFV